MHQSIMTKINNYVFEDWTVLNVIKKHSIKIFQCYYKENKQHEKMGIMSNFIQTKALFL